MTMHELSQLYWLNKELERYNAKLAKLRSGIGLSSPNYDGMPKAHSNESTTERQAVELAELERTISALRSRIHEERLRLMAYIDSIPDAYIRVLFSYRFVDGLTWQQVAQRIGYTLTADAVRKACIRYLDSEKDTPV